MTAPDQTPAQLDLSTLSDADLTTYLAIFVECIAELVDADPADMQIDLRNAQSGEAIAPELWISAADILTEVRRRYGNFAKMPDSLGTMN